MCIKVIGKNTLQGQLISLETMIVLFNAFFNGVVCFVLSDFWRRVTSIIDVTTIEMFDCFCNMRLVALKIRSSDRRFTNLKIIFRRT